jgi:two-component system, OmpR family, aerobic respiration control sensor histidine kinase ArcB
MKKCDDLLLDLSNIVLKHIPVSVYWKDKDGVYLGCNEYMAHLAGVESSAQIIGKTDYDMPWHKEADALRDADKKVMASGQSITLEELGRLANGEIAIFLTTKKLLRDTDNNVVGIYGVSVDITDRKKLEKELEQAKEEAENAANEKSRLLTIANKKTEDAFANLQSIVSCMPGNVYWKDANGVYRGCNDAIIKMAGLKSREEFIGKTDFDFAKIMGWDTEVAKSFYDMDQEIIATGKSLLNHEEPPFQTADGNIIYQLNNKVPLFDADGNIVGVVGIGIDITERKAMEEKLRVAMHAAEASDRAKSEFIANMSHDVKTPLSNLISITGTLSKELEEPEVIDRLKMVNSAGNQLMMFFDNCLEMVRMEVGEVALHAENFNIKKLIDAITEFYEPSFYNKKLKFYVHYDRNLPDEIYASHAGLYRVVANLLSNAIKFTKEGTVKLSASLWKNPSDQKDHIKIEISDTGIGIAHDKLPTIFDRFSRGTPSYEGKFEGHGLGLHIVQKFIRLMGGDVKVETELRKGTRFIVTFPFQEPQEGKTKAPKGRVRANPDGKVVMKQKGEFPTEPTILVIEDNHETQIEIKSILNKLGYAVQIADSAAEVFEEFEVGKYILIVMDIGMPDMSGDVITKCIRRVEKVSGQQRVPIIGLTAHADDATKQACLDFGMNEILLKPLTEEDALMIVEDYIKKSD